MEPTFRKSMAWLHTWAGVVVSALLFAIFWMGTLSVFDREIDRWMMPMTRLPAPAPSLSLDANVLPIAQRLAANSSQWTFVLPTQRVPTLRLSWRDAEDKNVTQYLDPATGAVLPSAGTQGGTNFIYPFHYRLHLKFMDIGYWLVGIATMAMLVAMVSGVVIHKKIFREFFTFRPRKQTQRAALDLHNLTGVLALPFHFVIALSGLIILFAIYFPSSWHAAYDGDRQKFSDEASGVFRRDKAGIPGTPGSLDAMVGEAQRRWAGDKPAQVRVWYPGDAHSYVEVRRSYDERVTRDGRIMYFDGTSGALLASANLKPVKTTQEFIEGLHMIQFNHWTLRWLYFIAGLAGCVMIATGLLVWLEARRAKHAKLGLAGVQVVEALTVGSVPGIVIATFAFFVVNRLLPLHASFAGIERADLEIWVFYLAWILTFAHAAWRGRAAWADQSWTVALLATAAVLLNWITTGDHLLHTLFAGRHAVSGMDAMLLLSAAVAWRSALKLRQKTAASAVSPKIGQAERDARAIDYG